MSVRAVAFDMRGFVPRLVRQFVSPLVLRLGALLLLGVLPYAVEAQITYRAAANGTMSVVPVFRAATSSIVPIAAGATVTTTGSTVITPPATATLTIARPAGTALNDVLIASIAVSPSTATIVPPIGWTLIRRTDNAAVNSNSLAVYRKTATAAEPASYAFAIGIPVAGTVNRVGAITVFVNVDPVTSIDVENGQASASALTHATPSVATTVANAMVVTNHTLASSTTWTPPTGMTEIADIRVGTAPAGQSMERAWVTQAAAGLTGTKTATAATAANADAGVTHILALRPAATSGVAIARPAGTATNDLLIASIGIAWSGAVAPAVTPPAGWTQVRQTDNNNPTRNSLVVFSKKVAAGDPASAFFGVTNGAYIVGGMQSFYNVDATTPILIENGQITASGTGHATPSVITTLDNTLLVTSHTYASSRTWTPPAGMVEAFDRPSGANSATGQSIEGAWAAQQVAGPSGAKSATAAGNADRGATHIMALAPGPLPSLTITKPTGTVTNDVMIASIGAAWRAAVAPVVTPPAGWTLVRRMDNSGATANSLLVYSKVATAAEPADYSWTFTETSFVTGGILGFYNVDTAAPINVENGQNTTSGTAHVTPDVTTTVANTMLVTSHTVASSGTWTAPTGMTERVDQRAPPTANAVGQAIEVAMVLQAAAGVTGTKSATTAATADRGNAHILALRPAIAGPDHVELVHDGSALTCTPRAVTVLACITAASCNGIPANQYTAANFSIAMTAIAGANWCSDSLCATALPNPATVANGSIIYLRDLSVGTDRMGGTAGATTPTIQCTNTATLAAMNSTTECDVAYADSGLFFNVQGHRAEASQAVTVSAVKKSDDSLACAPAFASVNKAVKFVCSYSDPSSGTLPVRVGGAALNATNDAAAVCDGTGQNVTLAFNASGVASTTVQYADAGKMGLTATYTGSGAEAGLVMTGSDTFTAAPNSFGFSSITAAPIVAGKPFSATVTARNSAGARTPNFGNESTPEEATLSHTRCHPAGTAAVNGSFTPAGANTFTNGVATLTNLLAWSEVGNIDLTATLTSGNYLSSGPLGFEVTVTGNTGTGGTLCNGTASAGNVGRFIPDHFDTAITAPACAFNYSGQPMTTTITAMNGAATPTKTVNYDGSANTSPNFSRDVTLIDANTLASGSLTGTAVAASAFVGGEATATPIFTFASVPKDPGSIKLRASDADVTTTGVVEATREIRSGRVRLSNANGSERLALPVPMNIQYWAGASTGWITNAADTCTTIQGSDFAFAFGGTGNNLAACETAVTVGGTAPNYTVSLATPGAGNNGWTDLTLNLGAVAAGNTCTTVGGVGPAATTANRPWLQFNWKGAGAANPTARATFGVYRSGPVIQRRETY